MAHFICTKCEATIRECRLCRLSRQLAKEDGNPPDVHVQDMLAWAGRTKCAACGVVRVGNKLCGGCHCFRFCSDACQKSLWADHKSMCRWLRQPRPLIVILAARLPLAERMSRRAQDLVPPIRDFDENTSDVQTGAGSSKD